MVQEYNPIQARLTAVRNQFDAWQVDGIVVGSPINRRWLSGFTGSAGWLIITQETAVLATDFRYWARAQLEAPDFTLYKLLREAKALETCLENCSLPKMAIESEQLTLKDYARFASVKSVKWRPVDDAIIKLRAAKDEYEIDAIKAAAAITDQAMGLVHELAQPGITERQLAWRLEQAMRENGAERMGFDVSVASGPNAAFPHHTPSERQLQKGDAIIIDMGAVVDGYRSDMTRSFHLGTEPSARYREIYDITLRAQQRAINGMRVGMTGKEVDALARDLIADEGYGDHFGHGLGHGVGLDIHEKPNLGKTGNERLPAGSTITVEPGIYIPGFGGVRIEDLVLLTQEGVEYLSHCPKSPYIPIR